MRVTGSGGSHRTRWLLTVLVVLLGIAGAMWLFSGGERQRIMRAVQAYSDPDSTGGQSLLELIASHPRLSDPQWTAGWSDDDRLVSVEVRVTQFSDLQRDQPKLVASFLHQVAQTQAWSGVAGDQPAIVQVVLQATSAEDGSLQVQVASLRLTEAWAVYRPELVADYEKAIEAAIGNVDDRSRARQYRLRHEGERALFNAGLDGPMLAGPGMALDAHAAFLALLLWR
jgi:hypothetical protein